jgi:DNA-directed RNA polymerase subunit RPC12/RpoP
MSPGADLFVVCKQCGAEVSPYITECPYCGKRIRKRAPKLPREHVGRWRAAGARARRAPKREGALGTLRPRWLRAGPLGWIAAGRGAYVPWGVALATGGLWVVWHAGALAPGEVAVVGPLHGEWWRLFTYELIYSGGFAAYLLGFAVLGTVAVFGSSLERRVGLPVVLALFFGGGATGALVNIVLYPSGVLSGGNAGALALLGAWAAPELLARARERDVDEDRDLLGAAAIGAVLLAMPFAYPAAGWAAGVTGAALGLVVGCGISRVRSQAL